MFLRIFSFIFLVLCFCTNVVAAEAPTVRLSTGEWSPFISEYLDNNGMISQITKEAFAVSGKQTLLGFFPWARAAEMSKTGDWDGTIAFAKLPEREKFYFYSDPIYAGQYVFFYLKTYPFPAQWSDYTDLKDVTMAATRGYGGMGQTFIDAENRNIIHVLRVTSETQTFSMLMAGRVQAVPSDLEVGYATIRRLYGKESDKFTHNPKIIQNVEYHLVISKKTKNAKELIEKFNEGLRQLKKSGRYNEILRHWYNQPIYKDALPADFLKQMAKEKAGAK